MSEPDFDDTDTFWAQKNLEEEEMWERHRRAVEYHKETLHKMNTSNKEKDHRHDAIQPE